MSNYNKKCFFQEKWKVDPKYMAWLEWGKKETEAKCSLCNSYINLSNMGQRALNKHAKSKKHSQIVLSAGTSSSMILTSSLRKSSNLEISLPRSSSAISIDSVSNFVLFKAKKCVRMSVNEY